MQGIGSRYIKLRLSVVDSNRPFGIGMLPVNRCPDAAPLLANVAREISQVDRPALEEPSGVVFCDPGCTRIQNSTRPGTE